MKGLYRKKVLVFTGQCIGKRIDEVTAGQNRLEGAFKMGIRPQKHKRSDRIYF